MDPFTPPRRASDQPYKKVKFKATLTPQIHPPQTSAYSSNTWAAQQLQNDLLPEFSSPGILTPRAPFSKHAAFWVPPEPAASPLYSHAAGIASNPPRKSTKRTRRDSDTENVAPSGGSSAPVSHIARIKEVDEEIIRVSAELVRLREEREEL